jgi:hypothetical protein
VDGQAMAGGKVMCVCLRFCFLVFFAVRFAGIRKLNDWMAGYRGRIPGEVSPNFRSAYDGTSYHGMMHTPNGPQHTTGGFQGYGMHILGSESKWEVTE